MQYISTRGGAKARQLHDLLVRGTAEDGGLYVPQRWPRLSDQELSSFSTMPYGLLASQLLDTFGGEPWKKGGFGKSIRKTLEQFEHPEGPILVPLTDTMWSMELFHGPTFAFKDYALAPLAEIIDHNLQLTQKRATVLCATSGDTGAATARAFAGRERARAVILFPDGRVSDIQRKQMTTLGASNVLAICVKGDFDDCQNIVKQLYQSPQAEKFGYTAVNSINIVRILLQTAYYFFASNKVAKQGQGPVNFAVPSGNFGNIFAGYIAKSLGAPIGRLIVTSNENDVLPRLFQTGQMRKSQTVSTISPSMDIQVSSNFERMLWALTGRDGAATAERQKELANNGRYDLSESEFAELRMTFDAVRCGKDEALETMRSIKDRFDKSICPHSATGFFAADTLLAGLDGPVVVVETAHPAKFPSAAREAFGADPDTPNRLKELNNKQESVVTTEATVSAVQAAIDASFSA